MADSISRLAQLQVQSVNDVADFATGNDIYAIEWFKSGLGYLALRAATTAPDGVSRLDVQAIPRDTFPGALYELLGNDDTSDFLRWGNGHGGGSSAGGGSPAKVEFGAGTVNVNNAARGTGTVTHQLGRTPTAVLISGNDQGAGFIMAWTAGVFTSTQFNVAVDTNQVVTLTLHFSWIAIG